MISLNSPAKINLFLRVLRKREDGFHEIASLFQAVSLIDTLRFEMSKKDEIICDAQWFPKGPDNLILKAASLFRQKTGIKNSRIKVIVEKRIPAQAGLGGGSGNAATTLWALNQLHGHPAKEAELRDWSSEIGSDIPFFFSTGTSFCTGKGEQLEDFPSLADRNAWIVVPDQGLCTKKVFRRYKRSEAMCSIKSQLESFNTNTPVYSNDLEKAAFQIMPDLKQLKDSLLKRGGGDVVMTGSGSSLVCYGQNFSSDPQGFRLFPVRYINRKSNEWYL